MKFADPFHVLALPLLGAILLAVVAYVLSPTVRRMLSLSHGAFALRCATLACLAIAVAEPYRETREEQSSAVALLDISDSMDPEVAAEMLGAVEQLRGDKLQVDLIPFADSAAAVSVPFSGAGFRRIQESWSKLDIGATNLEATLGALLRRSPGSVLLLSDGAETAGSARKILPVLQQAGFRVYPLIPEAGQRSNAQFRISHMHAPLLAAAQKSVEVRTSVLNSTAQEQSGRLEIVHDEKVIYSEQIRIAPGQELVARAESNPSSEGIKEITARLVPEDKQIPSSTETIYVAGQAREKVLLVSAASEDERFLKQVLKSQAYQLETVLASSRGTSLPPLSNFSLVIFNNVPYENIARSSSGGLGAYVRGGGGFIMLGGNRSFGLGGFKDTPIEELLPVELLPPQTIKKRLNLGIQLVIDKSRSMAENEKLEYAKEAARETVRNLKDEDYVGVIGFDASPFVVVELGQVGANREKARERVGRLFPAGRTNMLPAIEEARRGLLRVNSGRKHIIVLTDGKIPDEGPYYIELVKQMRLMGISMSTVLLGSDADPGMLESMAQVGGGAFYQTNDPRSLPKIFVTDLKVSSGEQTLREEEFLVRPGTGEIRSTEIAAFPPVRGYVQTKARREANLELVAVGGNRAEPLLASWKVGKGTSIAFTSDANGRWSSGWVPWPKFSTFWGNLVDAAREKSDAAQNIRFDLRYQVAQGNLELDLSVFSDRVPGAVSARLQFPDGVSRDVEFSALSPGHYRGVVPGAKAGKYTFSGLVDGRPLTAVAFGLSGDLFGERKGEPFNLPLLYALADESGGKVNPTRADIQSQVYTRVQRSDLGYLFVALALVFLCVEVVLREIPRPPFRSLFTKLKLGASQR